MPHPEPAPRDLRPTGTIEIMPHLSAPIDEGVFIPYPTRTVWQTALRIGVGAAVTIVLVAAWVTHGAFLR